PPGSQSSAWSPTTPHNLIQLAKQASSIKEALKKSSQTPPTPTNRAFNQLIKGCELALHSAAILTKENHDLRAANENQKQKRTKSRQQIEYEGSLSIQEDRELISLPIDTQIAQ